MTSRKERTDARRVVQQQLAKERRRKRNLITSAAALAVLLVAGMIGWAALSSQRHATSAALTIPPSAIDDGTGFAVGHGPVTIDVYEDFMCPICGEFEHGSGATLTSLVTGGKVTVVYHPIAILDEKSSTAYSSRAAAASAAAAVGGKFLEFHNALFAQQPAEGSAGLSNEQLISIGRGVGLGDPFATAVKDGTYRGWATTVTDRATARNVTGTPTVRVGGKALADPFAPDALTKAVAAASPA